MSDITSSTVSAFASALASVRTKLMIHNKPTGERVSAGIADQLPRLREGYDQVTRELAEIETLLVELEKLRVQKSAEKAEAAATLNRLISTKADLDQV